MLGYYELVEFLECELRLVGRIGVGGLCVI